MVTFKMTVRGFELELVRLRLWLDIDGQLRPTPMAIIFFESGILPMGKCPHTMWLPLWLRV